MKKFTKICLWVISLPALLCACGTSTVSTMQNSQGPSSPSRYFLRVEAIPSVTSGTTSSIFIRVLDAAGNTGKGVPDATVTINGTVSSNSAVTDADGNATVSLTVSEGTNNVIVQFEDIGTSVAVLGQP